jgi:hypothetical protein
MPVLTIAGRHGVSDNLFNAMKSKADNLNGVITEDSGHFVPEGSPIFLVENILNFFTDQPMPNKSFQGTPLPLRP